MPEPGEDETVRVVALDRSFHVSCYKCEVTTVKAYCIESFHFDSLILLFPFQDCDMLLTSEAEGRGCYPLDDHILCKACNAKRVQMLTNRMTTEL